MFALTLAISLNICLLHTWGFECILEVFKESSEDLTIKRHLICSCYVSHNGAHNTLTSQTSDILRHV